MSNNLPTPHAYRRAGVLLLLAVLLALPLFYLYTQSGPLVLDTQEGAATIHFEAERGRLVFYGQCALLRWDVQQINAVKIYGRNTTGTDSRELCSLGQKPYLEVTLRDSTTRTYTLDIEPLYANPLVLALTVALLAALAGALYVAFGVPGLLAAVSLLVFGPMLRSEVNLGSNFYDHNLFAGIAMGTGNFNALPPHFLYHLLIIALHQLIPGLSLEAAGFLVALTSAVVTVFGVYALLWHLLNQTDAFDADARWTALVLAGLALALNFAGPITVFARLAGLAGRTLPIIMNTYHSPTFILLKPLAVLLFLCILRLLAGAARGWLYAAVAVLTLLATLAKPSYTLCILPAVGLLLIYELARRIAGRSGADERWWLPGAGLVGAMAVPAVAALAWQYNFLYGAAAQSTVYGHPAKIAFAPLELMLKWANVPPAWLLPDLLVSVLFPLAVYLLYYRAARRDTALNLAWLTFLGGAAIAYLFIERPGEGNGNLTWGAQVTLFVLFAASAGFLLRQNREVIFRRAARVDWRLALCGLIFAAHVASFVLR
jgi:hypothetical protein